MPTCVAAWASRYPGWAQLVMKFPGRFRSARPEATDEGPGQRPTSRATTVLETSNGIDRLCEKGVEASAGRTSCVIAPVCLDGAQRHPESGLVDSRRLQGITSIASSPARTRRGTPRPVRWLQVPIVPLVASDDGGRDLALPSMIRSVFAKGSTPTGQRL